MPSAKKIVYRYNGDATTDEEQVDMKGELPTPQKGEVIMRKGVAWKVVDVHVELTVNIRRAVPIYRVYLTNQF